MSEQLSTETKTRRAYYVEAWSDTLRTLADGVPVGPKWRRISFPTNESFGVPTGAFGSGDSEYMSYHAAEAMRHWFLCDYAHSGIKTRLVAVDVHQTTVVNRMGTCAELERSRPPELESDDD